MAHTPHRRTTAVLVVELDDEGVAEVEEFLAARGPVVKHRLRRGVLGHWWVREVEGIEDVLAITTGWARRSS